MADDMNSGGGGGNSALAALAAMHAHNASSGGGGGGGGSAAAGGLEHADGGIGAKLGLKMLLIDGGNTKTGQHLIANEENTQQGLCPTQVGVERFNTDGLFGIKFSDLFSKGTWEITPHTEGLEGNNVSDAPVDTSGAAGGGGDYGGGGGGGDYAPSDSGGGDVQARSGGSPLIAFEGHAATIEAPHIGGGGGWLGAILGGGGGGGGGMEL